jgi:hypothetical protein
MKALRASILVLALSICAYADGNMPTGIAGNMPTGVAQNMENDSDGNMPTGVADPITGITITVLQSVLSLI